MSSEFKYGVGGVGDEGFECADVAWLVSSWLSIKIGSSNKCNA